MKQTLFLITFLFFIQSLFAQDLHTRDKDLPCLNGHINLHMHVALDSLGNANISLAEMQGAVDLTNKFFAPICLTFSICEVDTIPNYNFDYIAPNEELEHMTTLYGAEKRLNVYWVGLLLSPTLCGLGGGNVIYLAKACPGAMPHEMGHVFGLAHTFEGNGIENVDGSNCETAGDGICDTPADPYNPALVPPITYARNCEFVYTELDANGEYYQPDIGNIMSYYGCDCGFTRGQYLAMAAVYLANHKNLW